MKKSECVEDILTMAKNMEPGIAEAKITDKHFFIHPNIIMLTAKELETGRKWLMDIYKNEYKEYQKIKTLCPPHVWEAYKSLDMESAREVVLLRKAIKALRKRFITSNKPMCFKKGFASVTIQKAEGRKKSTSSN